MALSVSKLGHPFESKLIFLWYISFWYIINALTCAEFYVPPWGGWLWILRNVPVWRCLMPYPIENNLFSPCCFWKIAHLALTSNHHSFTLIKDYNKRQVLRLYYARTKSNYKILKCCWPRNWTPFIPRVLRTHCGPRIYTC